MKPPTSLQIGTTLALSLDRIDSAKMEIETLRKEIDKLSRFAEVIRTLCETPGQRYINLSFPEFIQPVTKDAVEAHVFLDEFKPANGITDQSFQEIEWEMVPSCTCPRCQNGNTLLLWSLANIEDTAGSSGNRNRKKIISLCFRCKNATTIVSEDYLVVGPTLRDLLTRPEVQLILETPIHEPIAS